jgi:hypothetical protein
LAKRAAVIVQAMIKSLRTADDVVHDERFKLGEAASEKDS